MTQKTTKKDLILNKTTLIDFMHDIQQQLGIDPKQLKTKKDLTSALNLFLSGIKTALRQSYSIQILGFGTFTVVRREARKGRNPTTGNEIDIEAKYVVKFRPGKELRDEVNQK